MGVLNSKELVPRRPNPVEGRTEYKISIETGDLKGTKKIAVLVLYGTKGVTDEIEVDPKSGKFHKGSSEFFKTIQSDLGELWRIDLWLKDQSKTNEWYVNLIDIRQGDKLWTFPIYRWIDEREEVRAGKALLPQHEKLIECLQHRNEELEKKRGIYQFNQPVGDKLPSILKAKYEHLPTDEKFSPEKSEDFISARNRVAKDLIIDKFFHSFTPLNDFEDYEVLFTTIAKPRLHRTWRTDREFGWQRVKGASCTHIYKISKIPPKFGVTDEMVAKFLPPGTSLAKEAEQGKLFFLDFAVLEDVPVQSGRYICAPMCLLHINHEGDLLPIAIQLHQKPDPVSNPIWTPADSEPDWLLAKMWVALADVNVYQTSSHYTKTHLVMETVNVAVNRNFSLVHPIFKLLHPHFRFHLAINALARQSLIVPTGILVEAGPMKFSGLSAVIERTYKDWHWKQNSFPGMMKLRGFAPDGSDAPKCYYYAHDGYLLWNAIKDYTKEIVHIYYLGDSDTISDSELQSFATELHIAFGPGKGFPSKITSRDDLVEILASIIFQVSVQHAVLNFSQFESFAFVPFTPGTILMPPPGANGAKVVKGVATMQDIFKSMPSKAIAARQLAVLYLLSQYSSTDHMLGNFPEELFTEDKPKAAIANFQARLAEISAKIKSRGDWTNMSPEKIPNSTSI